MSQGDVWAPQRAPETNGSTDAAVEQALRISQEIAAATLADARAEADRIRADAHADAERIRADARAQAPDLEAVIASMTAEIDALAAQITEIEVAQSAPAKSERPEPKIAAVVPIEPPVDEGTSVLDVSTDIEGATPGPRPVAPESKPQQRLSPIPLEAVLPIIALILLLIVVLAWLG